MFKNFIGIILFTSIFLLLTISCANANYVGKSYTPTSKVDIYYSLNDIQKDYEIIGQTLGSGGDFVSNNSVIEEPLNKAKETGADAIIINEMGKMKNSDNITGDEKNKLKLRLLNMK